jgi:class 3 adenylate cyclase/tetratricopeptide (TPR) repeat protein
MSVCPDCGRENQPGARFCSQCGAVLAGSPADRFAERKVVTVLFADLVGFSARADALDPEDVLAIQRPFFEGARQVLERHGGTVEKYFGDAVVALFGAPLAHEDDPERAVRAALAVRDAINDLNDEDESLNLSIRVGVNTGEALIDLNARPDLGESMAAGDAINTAARIQSAAPVDSVLVGQPTYEATRDAVEYRAVDPIAAKGKSDPVPVWEAIRAGDVHHQQRRDRTRFIAREGELEQLLELWDAVRRQGLPGLAFIKGVPGIGKSRLIEEFVHGIEDEAAVHRGRCLPYGAGITYWPMTEIIKSAAGILQSDNTEVVGSKLGTMLERFGIEAVDERHAIAAAVSNLLGLPATPGTSKSVQLTQAELHWGVRRVLQWLARERPLALVVEDLHWAEPTLIELLEFLVEDEVDVPMVVLVSARPEAAEAARGLMRQRARSRTLRLEALSDEAAQTMVRELLGSERLGGTPASALLLRTAGGNPLFLVEMVNALREGGFLDHEGWHLPYETADLPTPRTLESLIVSRLDQLGWPAKQIAQHASVVGAVFWPGAVAYMQGDGRGVNAELVEHLATLERRDFVVEHDASTVDGEREFAFKHILIRDAAYGQLPRGRRIELHARFADWVSALSAADEFIEIVAWHLEHACLLAREVARPLKTPVGEAVLALSAAAEKAERREGFREADAYYARALELVPEEQEPAMELNVRRGNALIVLGRANEGLELLLPIAEAACAAGRLDLASEALMYIAQVDHRQGRAGDAIARLDESLELALQVGNRRLQVRAAFSLASVRGEVGAADAALEELGRAIRIAEEIGDRPLLVQGHLRAGFLLFNKGDLVSAEQEWARCSSLAAELGSRRDEARTMYALGLIKYYRGEPEEARQIGERAQAWLERTGETFFQIQNLIALAQYALAKDDPSLAEEYLRDALPRALDEEVLEAAEIDRLLTEALCRQGRVAEAAEVVQFAARDVPRESSYAVAALHLMGACVAVARRDVALATKHYEEAIALLDELGLRIELCQAWLTYGRALRELKLGGRAREQLELARAASVEMGATGLATEVDKELAFLTAHSSGCA